METELATAWTGQVLQSPLLSGPSESATSCQSLAHSTLPCCNVKVQMIYRCNCSPFCRLIWQMNCAKFSHYGKIQLSLTWHFGFIDLVCRRGGHGATSGFQLTPLAVGLLQLHAQTQRHLCVPQLRETVSMFVWNGSASARFLYSSPFARLLSPFFVFFPLPARPLLHSLLPWKWPCWCGRNQLTINLLIKHTKSSGNENEIATKNLKRLKKKHKLQLAEAVVGQARSIGLSQCGQKYLINKVEEEVR